MASAIARSRRSEERCARSSAALVVGIVKLGMTGILRFRGPSAHEGTP